MYDALQSPLAADQHAAARGESVALQRGAPRCGRGLGSKARQLWPLRVI